MTVMRDSGSAATGEPYAPVRAFLRDLDGLVERSGPSPVTVHAVKERLASLLKSKPRLPEAVRRPSLDCYARHLLYRDPQERYEVVVMAWGPGQSTPVHDHSGIWCVEGVFEGVIDVTRYDLKELRTDDTASMECLEVIHAGLGECGALIPPVEYHRISNPYQRPAITIHVYGGRMRTCRVFLERDDHTYLVSLKELGYASPDPAIAPLT